MEKLIVFIAFFDNLSQQPIISPLAATLDASPTLVGLIVGIYSIFNVIGNMSSPLLSRKYGLTITIRASFIGVSLILLSYTLVQTPEHLLFVRALHGITAGFAVPCIFSLISLHKHQGHKMSQVGRTIGLAAILGPPMAGLLGSRWGFSSVFYLLSALFIIGALLTKKLPPTKPMLRARVDLRNALTHKGLSIAYASAFSLMFATGMLGFWFPLQLLQAGYPLSYIGIFFGLFGLAAIAIMPVSGVQGVKNPVSFIAIGFSLLSLGLLIVSLSHQLLIIGFGMFCYGLGFGCVFPAMNLLVVAKTNINNRTSAFAIFHSFFSLAVFIAPLIGGATYRILHPLQLVVLVIAVFSLIFFKSGLYQFKTGTTNQERGEHLF